MTAEITIFAYPGACSRVTISALEEIGTEFDVRWIDIDGNEQTETFTKLWATCVQHEIDHLDGKLFIDYLKPMKRQMITRKMTKLKRELARG